jgi:23S rRNA G2069 N7-methylase RlmK/C1962 C5-methylase RlmI
VTKVFSSGVINKKRTVALDNLSMSISTDKPAVRAIAGESGSGKTTLGMILMGFVHPTSGSVLYQGKDTRSLNNYGDDKRHTSFAIDAFSYLNDIKDKYDVIILDPPAFAKHNNALDNALQGYKRLNMKAIEQIKPGGIIFTFSCSQVVTRENFRKSVFAAAANTGRSVRILHQLSQPPDHPVNIYHPESEYLKGLVIYVD